MFFTNPFVKRSALNSQLTCRFGNGIITHRKNTQHVYFVNQKDRARKACFYAGPGSTKEYRICAGNRTTSGTSLRLAAPRFEWSLLFFRPATIALRSALLSIP